MQNLQQFTESIHCGWQKGDERSATRVHHHRDKLLERMRKLFIWPPSEQIIPTTEPSMLSMLYQQALLQISAEGSLATQDQAE